MVKKIIVNLIILAIIFALGYGWIVRRIKASSGSILAAAEATNSQNADKFGVSSIKLPVKDAPGIDFPGIKRYESSVRTKYESTGGITTIEYQTHALEDVVLSYYKSELAKNDWVLQYSREKETCFIKANQKVTLKTQNIQGITYLTFVY
jgi:hypothetical protein